MSSDARKFPRVPFTNAITIEVSGNPSPAELEDLTVEGASFIFDEAMSSGTLLTVKFPGSSDMEPADLMTEVVRCEPKPGGRYSVAVQFSDADDQYLMDILSLIHRGHTEKNK